MTRAFRPTLPGAVALVAICSAVACSPSSARGPASPPGQKAFMAIEPSSIVMTLENKVSQPLLDVRIAIRPIGNSTEFDELLTRLDSGESTVSLGNSAAVTAPPSACAWCGRRKSRSPRPASQTKSTR